MKKKLAVVVTMVVVLMTGCGAKENKTANNTEVPVTEVVADTEEPEEQEEQETVAGMKAKVSAGEIVIASNTDTEVAAEEVATKETADTGATGNKTSGNKSNTSSGVAANTNTSSNSNSGTTSSNSGTAHKHTWVAYEGSGHYETKVIKEAWDEPVYEKQCRSICNQCGADITGDPWGHMDANIVDGQDTCGGYHAEYIQVQTGTRHHDAETTQVWVWDVAPYAQCSECGEIGPVGAGISFD